MKTAFLLFFLSARLIVSAQTAEQKKLLENYFQLLPVCGPSAQVISAIDNDPRFIADSVVNGRWVSFHLSSKVIPLLFPEDKRIYLGFSQRQYNDSVLNQVYDTSTVTNIGCYFSNDDEGRKSRDSFYRQVSKDLGEVFPEHESKKGKKKLLINLYKLNHSDNIPCIITYSGYSERNKGYYINIIYDRRQHYDLNPPRLYLRIY